MTFFTRVRHGLRQNQWFRWVLAAVFGALVGVAAGRNFKGSVSIVDGDSMAPTYHSGARVFSGPILTPLLRGDIVMVDDHKGEYALKRIVGLPGETVRLYRGYVFINQKMLVEPYLPKYTLTFPDQRREQSKFKLGLDEYFVLGDNRLFSLDSRAYGPVRTGQIHSRVPSPENVVRCRFAPLTLPAPGKTTIRPLEEGERLEQACLGSGG